MIPILQALSRDDLVAFHHAYLRATHALFRHPYASQIKGMATEDNVVDTLEWVVSQGQSYYDAVRDNPSCMPQEFVDHSPQDAFGGLAAVIHLNRFGEFIPDPDWSR